MTYFSNITSFAELKKQYRKLAVENHPDRGGTTEAMQKINAEYEKLHPIWEKRTPTEKTNTGYENDYAGATAKEYTEYVYNEYRFRGSNYTGQYPDEVVVIIRKWLKETYPHYKFSLTRRNYNSISLSLLQADFHPFIDPNQVSGSVNHYYIKEDDQLTDRAKEVLIHIYRHVNSYNFDDSDAMTDYFHTNFYFHLSVGTWKKMFKYEPIALNGKKSKEKVFKRPEGEAHKAIRRALGENVFDSKTCYDGITATVLGYCSYNEKGERSFHPNWYSSTKQAQKRLQKLQEAGMICDLIGSWNNCRIQLIGYTPETEAALKREKEEADAAEKAFNERKEKGVESKKQKTRTKSAKPRQTTPHSSKENSNEFVKSLIDTIGGFEIIDYSPKAFAVFGDTKPIKEKLMDLGGTYNPGLKTLDDTKKPGYIFSKKKLEQTKVYLEENFKISISA